jgi:two-component system, NtrC family, response regulator AtoC
VRFRSASLALAVCSLTVSSITLGVPTESSSWHDAMLPTSFRRLTTLAVSDAGSGWAGGRDGLMLHWNGRLWQRTQTGIKGDVVAMAFATDTEGWVAAYEVETQQSRLYRHHLGEWQAIDIPYGVRVTTIAAEVSGAVWLFGQGGRILQYERDEWSEFRSPGYRTPLDAIATTNGEVWAVGEFGTVWCWKDSEWESIESPVDSDLNGVAWSKDAGLWIVGDDGVVMRRVSDGWDVIPNVNPAHLLAVDILSNESVYFCGSDALLHWDGDRISEAATSVHGDLRAIAVGPNGTGWAVGFGAALRRLPDQAAKRQSSRLGFYHIELQPNTLGIQGIAFEDVNQDGADDLYLVAQRDGNHLLLNDGQGGFRDMTGTAGVMGAVATAPLLQQIAQHAAVWLDYNNDSRPDLAVAGWHGSTNLYRQERDGNFVDVTDRLPLEEGPISINAFAVSDVNGDGWLDIFATNEHGSNRLWMNSQRGGWYDATEAWQLTSRGGSKQATFGDLDNDGDPDLYVCNWNAKNTLYRNDGDHFELINAECVATGDTAQSNGVTLADLDNDLDLDIVVTRVSGRNSIYRNDLDWRFTETSGIVGFASGPNSCGSTATDFDHDGDLDLLIVNNEGINYFENVGHMTYVSTVVDGMIDIRDARGVATADIDQDGDIDLFVGSQADLTGRAQDFRRRRSACFINKLDESSSVVVRLKNSYANTSGIGGRITLWSTDIDGRRIAPAAMREITTGSGYFSQNSSMAHFGIDPDAQYGIEVRFPSGAIVDLGKVSSGDQIVVREQSAVVSAIMKAYRSVWNWLWSDIVREHLWLLIFAIPAIVFGVRTASNRFVWNPLLTAGYAVTLSVTYAMLVVTTASESGWFYRIMPLLAVFGMLGVTLALAYWSRPTLARRSVRRQQLDALSQRSDLSAVLSSSQDASDIADLALREIGELVPVEDSSLIVASIGENRVETIVPADSVPGIQPGDEIPEGLLATSTEKSIVYEDPALSDTQQEDYVSLRLPLVTRDAVVGVICGRIRRRDAHGVDAAEPALRGFASLLAMSIYNAQLQQQARRFDADYRRWLDSQVNPASPSESALTIHSAINRQMSIARKKPLKAKRYIDTLVGHSPLMEEVLDQIHQVSKTDTTVLLSGESGSGKELLARAIHEESHRHEGPFVALNCGAIPEGLLESELFGHMKGAFTGANEQREGVFQRANEGTIFLDEIAEMNSTAQVRLLRVLQERTVTPVGGNEEAKVDVRVIAASHHDLAEDVSNKTFREDVFYRLNVFPIALPPLRDRMQDLPELVATLIQRISSRTAIPMVGLTVEAVEALMGHNWPGNVRELENVLERAALMADGGPIDTDHVNFTAKPPARVRQSTEQPPLAGQTMQDVEKRLIEETLRECDQNVSETARRLEITRDILRYRMKKYGINRAD